MAVLERRRLTAFAEDIARVREQVGRLPAESLLDVGGGTGVVTEAFARGIPRVTVVEPNSAKRAKGAKRRPQIDFVAGDAEHLKAPDASVDAVTSVVAFHHFPDQAAALREMRRVLRPGGRLILFEFRPEHGPGPFWRLFAGHTHFLDPEALARLVSDAGFVDSSAAPTRSGYLVAARKP